MTHPEQISLEEICGQTFKKRQAEVSENGKAAFTHYLHNQHNGEAQFFHKEAVTHVKRALEYKYPDESITNIIAEQSLQTMLFNLHIDVPFPPPENPKFTFIDLFAGIGGFRLALQNLGGKCVFASEWDVRAKQTYEANFGEVPFGDITKDEYLLKNPWWKPPAFNGS